MPGQSTKRRACGGAPFLAILRHRRPGSSGIGGLDLSNRYGQETKSEYIDGNAAGLDGEA